MTTGYSGEDYEAETEKEQHGLNDGHAFLEYNFIGKDVEPGADG